MRSFGRSLRCASFTPHSLVVSIQNKMSTDKTIKNLINNAQSALVEVNNNTSDLFNSLYESAQDMEFSSAADYKHLVQSIKDFGVISDSASFIDEHIPNYSLTHVVEMPLSNIDRDINNLNGIIQDLLEELDKSKQSFVYMAWKQKPEEYFYIGKAKSNTRVNLAGHGNLLASLQHATYFTMLFPFNNSKKVRSNLEAALINLVKYKTGSLPKYNTKMERFKNNDYECSFEREQISDLFNKLSSLIK